MTNPSPTTTTTAATAAAAPRSVAFAFAPGWYLYPATDGSWRLATPTGAFVRVNGQPEALRACASGQRASGDDALIAGLRAHGALTEPTSTQAAAPGVWREELQRRLTVHVEGDDPVAEAAIALLAPQAEVVTGTVDEDAVAGCDALLSSSPQLTDRRWQQVDAWCRTHATTWTTCCTEGRHVVLGPAGRPGVSASYGDVRGRRLAAAALPEELAQLWTHLDGGAGATAVTRPDPQASAVAAGLLVHDLLAAARGQATGRQLVVDTCDLTVTTHPVLALPRGIPALTR